MVTDCSVVDSLDELICGGTVGSRAKSFVPLPSQINPSRESELNYSDPVSVPAQRPSTGSALKPFGGVATAAGVPGILNRSNLTMGNGTPGDSNGTKDFALEPTVPPQINSSRESTTEQSVTIYANSSKQSTTDEPASTSGGHGKPK
jgi:hypothetical protein